MQLTGGASGIGVETLRALAIAGARVVIATRDHIKGEAVPATLRKETGNDRIGFQSLDLASLVRGTVSNPNLEPITSAISFSRSGCCQPSKRREGPVSFPCHRSDIVVQTYISTTSIFIVGRTIRGWRMVNSRPPVYCLPLD
jgi:hypothetical protein